MENLQDNPGNARDPQVWEVAKRRVSFRYHLATYIIVIGFLWLVWFFTDDRGDGLPWPIWPMGGWGIGLLFHFMGAYVFPNDTSVEREYERMMRNRK